MKNISEENIIIKELTLKEKIKFDQDVNLLNFSKIEKEAKELTEESFYRINNKIFFDEKEVFIEENTIIKELSLKEQIKFDQEANALNFSKIEKEAKELTEESFIEENGLIKELTSQEKIKFNQDIESLKISQIEKQVKEITEEWHF